jgi:hypothetical protein
MAELGIFNAREGKSAGLADIEERMRNVALTIVT